MSKQAFTEGPWVAHFSTRSIDVRGNNWKEADGVEYRPLIVTLHGYREWAECCANAHLISAAPLGYELAQMILRDSTDMTPEPWIDAAEALIAKAEGRS